MSVTSNILQRTFQFRYKGEEATCFSIDVDNRRYLVTARHLVDGIEKDSALEVYFNGRWTSVPIKLVGHGEGDLDVSVLAPQLLFGASHPLVTTTAKLVLAEDVYFLGYPYGWRVYMSTLNDKFPLPLVKKATVSALGLGDSPILLDGHNNPGFSGGPVARRGTSTEQIVIGVVSGYHAERPRVVDQDGNRGPYTYIMNTGIVVVYDIRHALQFSLFVTINNWDCGKLMS